MKFGHTFDKSRDPELEGGYVEYNYLKRCIREAEAAMESGSVSLEKAIVSAGKFTKGSYSPRLSSSSVSGSGNDADAAGTSLNSGPWTLELHQLLRYELDKVEGFIDSRSKMLVIKGFSTLRSADDAIAEMTKAARRGEGRRDSSTISITRLRSQTDQMRNETIRLDKFIQMNYEGFQKISKKMDRRLGLHLREYVHHRLASGIWVAPLERLLVLISEVYTKIRTLEAGVVADEDKDAKWVAPTDFERQTDKYWVRWGDLISLQLMIVEHFPLLIYGSDGSLVETDIRDQSYEKLPNASDSISSLYLDSDDLSMYKPRISREEGAILIRLRWYGSRPQNDEKLYVERKTHHEPWVCKKSIKERLIIRAKAGRSFLDETWDEDRIVRELTAATDGLEGGKLDQAVRLCSEIQASIKSRKLRPMVRTTYKRVAFQFPSNNIVRFTLDSDLCISDEASIPLPEGDFCHSPDTKLDSSSIIVFPYAVMEVKLQGAPPAFVQSLLDSGLMIDSSKFSKFLTGQAIFRQVPVLPYWSEYEELKELFHGADGSTARNKSIKASPSSAGVPTGSEAKDSKAKKGNGAAAAERAGGGSAKTDGDAIDIVITSPTAAAGGADGCRRRDKGDKGDNQKKPAAETPSRKPQGRVLSKARIKVEPKTFFANERTFIQWLSMSLLLISFALAMYSLDDEESDGQGTKPVTSNISAFSLVIVGCCFAIYALGVYLYRRHKLVTLSPKGFDALAGPVFLVVGVLTAVVVSLIDRDSRSSSSSSSLSSGLASKLLGVQQSAAVVPVWHGSGISVFPSEAPGLCHHLPLRNTTSLTFMPGGLAILQGAGASGGSTYTSVSASDIVTLDLAATGGRMELSLNARAGTGGGALGDIALCGSTAYVVGSAAAKDQPSVLLAFDTVTRSVRGQWAFPSSFGAGGLAIVPDAGLDNATGMSQVDCDSGRGRLLVAETSAGGDHELVAYALPSLVPGDGGLVFPVLTRLLTYNSRLLFGNELGAQASRRRAAALHYDAINGVLVVLHNEAGVLRSWRLDDGSLIGQATLPGDTRLWEGMHIANVGDSGSPSSAAVITLALNTPAAVWEFAIARGPSGELGAFPACANAMPVRI